MKLTGTPPANANYFPAVGTPVPDNPWESWSLESGLWGPSSVAWGVDQEANETITGYMVYEGSPIPKSQSFLLTTYLGAAVGFPGTGTFSTTDPSTASATVTDLTYGGSANQSSNDNWVPTGTGPQYFTYLLPNQTPDPKTGMVAFSVNSISSLKVNVGGDASEPVSMGGESFTVTPFNLTLTGTTPDTSGNQNILIGQKCGAYVNWQDPLPSGWSASYQWTVNGATFSSFYVSSNQSQGYPVLVPAPTWQSANPTWYWRNNGQNWGKAQAENISVVVTLTDPLGSTHGFTLSQPVQLWAPTAAMVNPVTETSVYTVNGIGWPTGLYSDPAGASSDEKGFGISYDVWALDPDAPLFNPSSFGTTRYGTTSVVQVTNFYTNGGGFNGVATTNGEFWLDGQYPYGDTGSSSPLDYSGGALTFTDGPYTTIASGATGPFEANCSFQDTILYTPPGNNSIPVPIWEVDWQWNAEISQAENGGIVETPPFDTSITASNYQYIFPTWYNILAL